MLPDCTTSRRFSGLHSWVTSARTSPSHSTRSACFPGSRLPTWSLRPRSSAPFKLADRKPSSGSSPYLTISASSRALAPCTLYGVPASVPSTSRTPAWCARRKLSTMAPPVSAAPMPLPAPGAQLVVGELLRASLDAWRHPPAGRDQLDAVGACLELLADGFADLVRTVGLATDP